MLKTLTTGSLHSSVPFNCGRHTFPILPCIELKTATFPDVEIFNQWPTQTVPRMQRPPVIMTFLAIAAASRYSFS